MKEELGVTKTNKRVPAYLTGLLSVILIATYIFTLKNYEPANNIIITGGIIVYPFSFLIIALISKYYGYKEARKTIFSSVFIYLSFIAIMMIGARPTPNASTSAYNSIIQYFFTNESITIGNFTLYYPILGQLLSVLVSYLVSHLIYATVYNAVYKFTIDYLAMGLSLFISYIIDRLLFMPILFASGLISESNTFDYLIKCLTSEMIAAIMLTIVLIIVYVLFTTIKNAIKKN